VNEEDKEEEEKEEEDVAEGSCAREEALAGVAISVLCCCN
jgi:hypothetical protein